MQYRYHSNTINPGPSRVLVYGANMAAWKVRGWARQAVTRFDAGTMLSSGAMGMAYAIPIKDAKLQLLPIQDIAWAVKGFLNYATQNADQEFWIARFGDDCTALSDSRSAVLFKGAPPNCVFPEAWGAYLEPTT